MDISNFHEYMDKKGLLVQKDLDGGDSAHRMGIFVFCLWAINRKEVSEQYYDRLVRECYAGRGLWRRHPNEAKWYSNPNNFSRDQFEKVWLASLINPIGFYFVFTSLFRQILRLGFHQNIHKGTDCEGLGCYKLPDFIGIGQIQNFLRAYLLPISLIFVAFNYKTISFVEIFAPYGWLMFLDLKFLADLYFRKKQPWDYDALMLSDLIFAARRYPTLISILATVLYVKTDWKERIRNNFGATDNDIKPLGELYIQAAIENFFEYRKLV